MIELIKGLDSNIVSLISGVLSMAGGALGAIGAYMVAKHQINKTRKIDAENRLIDKKITKLEETIRYFNDLKYLINSTDGNIKNINLTIEAHKNYNHIVIAKSNFDSIWIENLNNIQVNIERILNGVNVNKWYVQHNFDYEELYKLRLNYANVIGKYRINFSSFKHNETINLTDGFVDRIRVFERAYDKEYKIFIDFIEKVIVELENENEKILSIKK